ncbi:hypothetical protein C2857_003036 [Epichloe festucae Fl1]|uniref:Endochitinase 1 n=1 Tax=Epichloe festucae (strain Fl1) TaxID=877507 RepID=A0A7S9KRZ3_EPIFF|nr:hypothetical protein C2857_003036 [Epichloe festucae Fl1]
MHRALISALPLLAGVANAAPARHQEREQAQAQALEADRRDLICIQVEPSTVFLPTTVYVTATASPSHGAEPLFTSAVTVAVAPALTTASAAAAALRVPLPVSSSGMLRWGNVTQQWTNTTTDCADSAVSAVSAESHVPNRQDAPAAGNGVPKQTPVKPNKIVAARNVLYFTNWGIYDADCQPQNLPADKVTHLLYAFGDLSPDGTVISSDTYADVEKRFAGDTLSKRGNNAYGVVNQLFALKKKNRGLKTLFSIGGSVHSRQGKFSKFAASEQGRKKFAASAVEFMADWGMDGVDIDWEHPRDAAEARSFVELLRETRLAMDRYAADNRQRYRYLLTVAAPAAPEHYRVLDLEAMDRYVDAWHLMGYDYAGAWDKTAGHQSNIRPDGSGAASTKFDTDQAVADYTRAGVPGNKIVLGLPLYGRSFGNTDGLGKPFEGAGRDATQEGVIPYRQLPRPGAVVRLDQRAGATWSYDPSSRELVSYDDVESARLKASYVKSKRLGGAVFWEASGDKKGDESLVRAMAGSLGKLDDSENMLHYPNSRYDNIRNGLYS